MIGESTPRGQPLNNPVDFSSAFWFDTQESLAATHQLKFERVRYGRDSGVGQNHLEKSLEQWHPGFRVLTFRSGMSALQTVLHWAWSSSNHHFVQSEVYRKTAGLIDDLTELSGRQSFEINLWHAPVTASEAPLPGSTSLVILEVPSNPHLRIPDWPMLFRHCTSKPFVVVDATLSGLANLSEELVNQADAIVYSLTKYIGGHNDLIGGAIFVRPDRYKELWEIRSRLGNIIGPMEAFLASRSMKTFDLRWERQCEVADEVFEKLSKLLDGGSLASLNFPGAGTNSDQHSLAQRSLLRRGAVMSFTVGSDRKSLAQRMSDLKTVKMAPSFGSTDSLIEICSLMSQPDATDEQLEKSGIEPTLIRLSIGIEDPDLIFSDIRGLVE